MTKAARGSLDEEERGVVSLLCEAMAPAWPMKSAVKNHKDLDRSNIKDRVETSGLQRKEVQGDICGQRYYPKANQVEKDINLFAQTEDRES